MMKSTINIVYNGNVPSGAKTKCTERYNCGVTVYG